MRGFPIDAISIRPASIDDAEDVARIRALAGWMAYQPVDFDTVDASESPFWFPDNYRRILSSNDGSFYVAQDQSHIVGFLKCIIKQDGNGVNYGELEAVYVDPPHQGRGIGKRLMTFAVDRFRAEGCQLAILWVREKNTKAQAFYSSQGWKPDGETKQVRNLIELTGASSIRYRIIL